MRARQHNDQITREDGGRGGIGKGHMESSTAVAPSGTQICSSAVYNQIKRGDHTFGIARIRLLIESLPN